MPAPVAPSNHHPAKQQSKKKNRIFQYCADSDNRVHLLRYFVCGCLFATTVICGLGSYELLYQLETKLETSQYDSLALQLSHGATESLNAKVCP
jgi:hypothetical protein